MVQDIPVRITKPVDNYIPALDGFRAIAILLVLLTHYGFTFFPGGFGVTLFFFISGFLITRLLLAEVRTRGHLELKSFYIRRLLRLYPALLTLIVLSGWYAFLSGCKLEGGSVGAALFYYQNYYAAYAAEAAGSGQCPKFFLILWSLAVEEHFYLFYPLLFGLLWHRVRLFIAVMGAICVFALLRRIGLFYSLTDAAHAVDVAGSLTEARLDSIMYGCLVAVGLSIDTKGKFVRAVGTPWVVSLAVVVLLVSIGYRDDLFRAAWRYTLQSAALSCIVPAVLFHPVYRRVRNGLSLSPLLYVGRLSYSLYLFHWFGLCVAFSYLQIPFSEFKIGHKSFYAVLALAIPLGVATTLFCFYCIERPMIALRKRFGSAGI